MEIKEESIQVTIKKFISEDGTEFISDGPSKQQINYAKSQAEHRNLMFDYLHFKIDESLLYEYKSENWLHFKWQFIRNYLKIIKWSNGFTYHSLTNEMSFSDINNMTENDFLKIVQDTIFKKRNSREYGYLPNLYNNDKFLKILLFSGILNYDSIKSPYRQSVGYKILKNGKQEEIPVSPTLDIDYRSKYLFNVVRIFNKTDFLKKLVELGYVSVTPEEIADYCRDVQGQIMDKRTLNDYFYESWFLNVDSKKTKYSKKEDYLPKGTLKFIKIKESVCSSEEEIKFEYFASEEAEKFLKNCFDSCKSDKNEILKHMLAETNGTFFMGGEYGGVCIWYQHFYNMTEKQSFKKGQEIYASYVYLNTRWYDELKKFAKPDDNFMDIILDVKIFSDQDYDIENKINFLTDLFPNREEEIELWSMWATRLDYIPSSKYNLIKEYYKNKNLSWNYKEYKSEIDKIFKSKILKDKLNEVKKNQEKLKKEEEELLELMKK
jgi:hypothetical protein